MLLPFSDNVLMLDMVWFRMKIYWLCLIIGTYYMDHVYRAVFRGTRGSHDFCFFVLSKNDDLTVE